MCSAARRRTLTIDDTPGTSPFDKSAEMPACESSSSSRGPRPLLVLAAGADAREAGEPACRIPLRLAAAALIATRLDAARRFGGLIDAAEVGGIAFAGVTAGPNAADAREPDRPGGVARLLLRRPRVPRRQPKRVRR